MNYSDVEVIALTQKMIQIESTNPGAFEGAMGDFVYNWLKDQGAEVYKEPVTDSRFNVIAKIKGKVSDPNLVFTCHMDTVPLGDGWDHDPLGAEISDGKMWGRGTSDMKGGLACGMIAFRDILKSGKTPEMDFILAATVDEEDIMIGAEQLIKDGIVSANSYVLDSEATEGQVKVAHKGKTWFRLDAHGKICHASTPEKGSDAVAAMSEVICAINRRLKQLPSHEELGVCAATFGLIEGGLNLNIVPDHCYCTIDMRLVPPTTNEQSIKLVEDAIKEGCANVPGSSCEYTILAQRPVIEKDPNSPFLALVIQAAADVTGKKPEVGFFSGYTDTAVIAGTLGNHHCISYGPGMMEVIHKPNEYVPTDDLIRCADVMRRVAELTLFK